MLHGPDLAPGEPAAERADYGQVIMEGQLRQALQRLNPDVLAVALDDALRCLTKTDSASLVANKQEKATQTVLDQAEVLAKEWAVGLL